MGDVISFEKGKRKRVSKSKSNKKKSKMTAERTASESNRIDVDYADMEPDEQVEYWKNIEKEEEEKFKVQYSDVLEAVPADDGARIQYFAAAMLKLIPNIFHGSRWDTRFGTFMDFCQFYITEFDPAYSDYIQENKESEKPYLYRFKDMAAEKLEEELEDCLKKIVEICLEKQEEDKAEMLHQAARLFELEEILSDIFYKELMKE